MSSSDGRPFQEHEVRDYEHRRYRGWDQKIVHRREMKILRTILKEIEEKSQGLHGAYVLDAPCGYGRFSSILLEKSVRLVDADLSFSMVERARNRENISTIPMGTVANLTQDMPFRPHVFPLILSMRFFHHLHQPEERGRVLREFARSGAGWLILSYYQANALHHLQRKLRRLFKKSKTRIKMIGRREFRQQVEEAGFEIIRIFPLFRGIHAHHIALLKKS